LSLKKLVSACQKAYKSREIFHSNTLVSYPHSSFQKAYITEISDP
jgi:hypothetical protein